MSDINEYPIIRTNGQDRESKFLQIKNNCADPYYCEDNLKAAKQILEVQDAKGNWQQMTTGEGQVVFGSSNLPKAR